MKKSYFILFLSILIVLFLFSIIIINKRSYTIETIPNEHFDFIMKLNKALDKNIFVFYGTGKIEKVENGYIFLKNDNFDNTFKIAVSLETKIYLISQNNSETMKQEIKFKDLISNLKDYKNYNCKINLKIVDYILIAKDIEIYIS